MTVKGKKPKTPLINTLTVDAIKLLVRELQREENRFVIEAKLIDPLIDHVISKVKPFMMLMTALFLIIIILVTFVLYLSLN